MKNLNKQFVLLTNQELTIQTTEEHFTVILPPLKPTRMIKVVLIEDEIPAKKKLKSYLAKLDSTIEIVKETDTVQDTLAFLQTQPQIDLIFSDIELRDGNVFEAYQQIHPDCPIIFATAYDQFWMNAFETSGIEYLLKPYTFTASKKLEQIPRTHQQSQRFAKRTFNRPRCLLPSQV